MQDVGGNNVFPRPSPQQHKDSFPVLSPDYSLTSSPPADHENTRAAQLNLDLVASPSPSTLTTGHYDYGHRQHESTTTTKNNKTHGMLNADQVGFHLFEYARHISAVAKSYKKSRARLILMDYGGTIVSNDNLDNLSRFQVATKTRAYSVPTKRMIVTITELCKDKCNIIFIVSGKESHSLTRTLNETCCCCQRFIIHEHEHEHE